MSENEVVSGAVMGPVEAPKPKRKMVINQDDMTLGEMEEFEDIVGKPFSEVMKATPVIDPVTGKPKPDPKSKRGKPLMQVNVSMRAMVALLFLSLRKEPQEGFEPITNIEQVRALRLSDFDLEIEKGADDDDDDEEAADRS